MVMGLLGIPQACNYHVSCQVIPLLNEVHAVEPLYSVLWIAVGILVGEVLCYGVYL